MWVALPPWWSAQRIFAARFIRTRRVIDYANLDSRGEPGATHGLRAVKKEEYVRSARAGHRPAGDSALWGGGGFSRRSPKKEFEMIVESPRDWKRCCETRQQGADRACSGCTYLSPGAIGLVRGSNWPADGILHRSCWPGAVDAVWQRWQVMGGLPDLPCRRAEGRRPRCSTFPALLLRWQYDVHMYFFGGAGSAGRLVRIIGLS